MLEAKSRFGEVRPCEVRGSVRLGPVLEAGRGMEFPVWRRVRDGAPRMSNFSSGLAILNPTRTDAHVFIGFDWWLW